MDVCMTLKAMEMVYMHGKDATCYWEHPRELLLN